MNITISKTSALRAIIIFTALVLLGWAGTLVFSAGYPARWFAAPTPIPQGQPAMRAVTAMYSADPASEKSAWEEAVCSGMTAKGCSLFQTMYAPAIWEAVSQKNDAAASMLQVADTLEDGSQIWKINVAWPGTSADIFIHVEADPASGQWLLERVLFTQEAAKYTE
jgi:hypothetical protein